MKLSFKKRSKLTKRYDSNPNTKNMEALDFQAKECVSLITASKERFIAKTIPKLSWKHTGQS